ncbi:ion transporter [Fodinicurvata sp. EGI_FJ10296]|uniref:ion transporter n=1 Tax=Fodinicurvata sp. EGI_FJ10296 TaxID=3231908 RepID=UPI003456FEE0
MTEPPARHSDNSTAFSAADESGTPAKAGETPATAPEGFRGQLARWIESAPVQRFITVLILINAVTLGLETSRQAMDFAGPVLVVLDRTILSVFVAELLIKLVAFRTAFFRTGWNWFDLIVVGVALVPATGSLSVLRAFRILRILRLVSVVPAMRRVVSAFAAAIPGMFSIIAVLMLVFYVSAVLATKLFGQHPDPDMQEWFGTIGASMYTLFQIMTLESWSMAIVRPTMELFPLAWLFFVPFIILTSFAVLNLFIGIIVDAMRSVHEADIEESRLEEKSAAEDRERRIADELAALREEVSSLRSFLSGQR